jgi:hypothetical protein
MDHLTPSQKGAVAEAGITSMVIQLGLTVLRPLCEGRRYDLAIDLEPELLRRLRGSNGLETTNSRQASSAFDRAHG